VDVAFDLGDVEEQTVGRRFEFLAKRQPGGLRQVSTDVDHLVNLRGFQSVLEKSSMLTLEDVAFARATMSE
jgi:hypothetical protein